MYVFRPNLMVFDKMVPKGSISKCCSYLFEISHLLSSGDTLMASNWRSGMRAVLESYGYPLGIVLLLWLPSAILLLILLR
jgi:hypothetical protein